MTCEELLQALNEYVDGHIDPAICESFSAHLAGCNPCQIVVDNIRQTIQLYKAGQQFTVPVALQTSLNAQLQAKWKATFGS